MSESMDDYKDELDASFKRINEGDLLDCTVVGVSETEATVDLQYNSAGIIRQEDFSSDPSFSIKQDVQIGDTFKATVLRMDDGRGNILLSKKAADSVLVWEKFAQMMKDGTAAEMKISEAVKGGAVGYLDGMVLFLLGLEDGVVIILPDDRDICRDGNDVHSVDVTELLLFRKGCTGHAGLLFVFVEEILEGDCGKRLAFLLDLDVFLRFNRLMQAVGIAASRHELS